MEVVSTAPERPPLRPWPAASVEMRPLDKIIPYERNARTHTPEQVEKIAASMQRFGVTAPLLVDEHGILLYGHGRRLAAERLGLAELPVSVAVGWSEDEKEAYRIVDNELALLSDWDVPTLRAIIGDLDEAGFDLPLLGFPDAELEQIMLGPAAPEDFAEYDENTPTEHKCPRCGYVWSGGNQ